MLKHMLVDEVIVRVYLLLLTQRDRETLPLQICTSTSRKWDNNENLMIRLVIPSHTMHEKLDHCYCTAIKDFLLWPWSFFTFNEFVSSV